MSRKPKRGYYVKGHFVAEGSELDFELKAELKGTTEQSKTDLKRESDQLQTLGEDLLTLRSGLLNGLELPEKLLLAVAEAKRITDFEGRRRQMQYIGKIMRQLDPTTLEAVRAALTVQHQGSAEDKLALHQAEQWRDRLIASDATLTEWLAVAHSTQPAGADAADPQHLRALIRQARKDAQATSSQAHAGAAVRHGKAYRDIFQLVKNTLATPAATATSPAAEEPPHDHH